MLDLSRSANVSDRIFAARKLRKLKTPEARARLREMAADHKGRVRRIAELARQDMRYSALK
ncbi:MAG: hypothetical protein QME60_00925 [Verrucomicrobiota bacterium]|nr:hypothetical protein [Verrucomicrobiota bacterium]